MSLRITEKEIAEIFAYAVSVRRELHTCPEVGFELPKTAAVVCRELDGMGIAHTDRYGKSSVVAELGAGEELLALRADMDALPIEEKTGLPYASRIPGAMHACGHDAHTAVLLGAAKYLKAHEAELKKRIRLIFQPAEESAVSGAKMMVENGVMEGVEEVLCTHCDNDVPVGEVGICIGDYMAACIPATITFYGKSSHATVPEEGIDAIAMAVEVYDRMKEMVTREAGDRPYIWSVGKFAGGTAHNIICDRCSMDISFRFYDTDFAGRVTENVHRICTEVAARFGGRVEIVFDMSTGAVHNDGAVCAKLREGVSAQGIPVREIACRMTSEDFGWYLTKTRGALFRFGTRNEEMGCTTSLHTDNFKIDEDGMRTALLTFLTYVFNN